MGEATIKGEIKRLKNRLESFQDSTPETDSWVICPVCSEPNPEGSQFCHHCWGAIIHEDSPVLSFEKMRETLSKRLSALKRKKTIKITVISSITTIVTVAILYPTLYFATGLLSPPPQDLNSNSPPGQWTMFRHDMEHSGIANSNDVLPQGKLKWVFPTGGAIHSSVAVANGTIYFGSQDHKLYALDAETGTKRWEFETGSWVNSSPAVANGVVYFGSNDSNLYALDADTGETLWVFETAYPISSSPAIAGDIVYFGADDYYIYAVNIHNGKQVWNFYTGSHVTSSPAIYNGVVYIGTGGNFLYALHALDGRRILRFKSHYPGFTSPVISNDIIYFTNSNGYLYAISHDARNFPREHEIKPMWSQLWVLGIPGIPQPPLQSGFLWRERLFRGITSSPMIAGDYLYIGSDKYLLAIDLQSEEKAWQFETGGSIWSTPTILGGNAYVGSNDSYLYAVDASTGEKLWDFPTGDRITASPTVDNGTIYVGSHDGNLYAIE